MINFWAVASLLLLSLPYIKTFKSINYVVGTGTRVKAIYSSSSNVEFIELGDETSNNLPKKLLYLPGIDGTGEYSNTALNTLQEDYRCWRMKINVDDRSSFLQIAQLVRKKMQEINDGQPMLLIGESFGGLLAAYIASRFPQLVDKLVLVNPATSYDRTLWRSTVPIITKTGPLFPAIGVSALVATSLDKRQIKEIGKNIIAKARNTDSKSNMMDEIAKELSPIMNLPNVLKAETLAWRAREWLDVGTFVTKDGINRVNSSTLILIGEEDRLLPSKGEGNRLKRLLTNAKVKVMNYPTRGHALLDNTFPLREVLSQFEDQIKRKSSGDLRINLPSGEDIKLLNERAGPLIKACSPVFFSTSSEDKVVEGLESIPLGCDGRPVLFVGNHQLFGLDLVILIKEFLDQRNVLIRGLAHPLIFNSEFGSGLGDIYERFGAVQVSPMSYYKLLKQNETILLFPGGISEALHRKGEANQLFWPEKPEFVGMAALANAIIVPFAAIGMAESTKIIADRDDILSNPVFGKRAQEMSDRMPQARAGGNESMIFPLIAPAPPSRNYFLFMKPYDTALMSSKNQSECSKAYETIKGQVETGISTLLKYREQDMYREYFPRVVYETTRKQKAPIPPVDVLESILRLQNDSQNPM